MALFPLVCHTRRCHMFHIVCTCADGRPAVASARYVHVPGDAEKYGHVRFISPVSGEQVNPDVHEYNQGIAVVIATCKCNTWTKALDPHPYISPYLCMKWRFTMGPSAELMYQLPGFLRSAWHLCKLKSVRPLFANEWSFGAQCTQTHARLGALSIHGKYIPMQPVARDILKHEWNLNEIFTSLRGAVHRSCQRVSVVHSVAGSRQGMLGNGGCVCNATWVRCEPLSSCTLLIQPACGTKTSAHILDIQAGHFGKYTFPAELYNFCVSFTNQADFQHAEPTFPLQVLFKSICCFCNKINRVSLQFLFK